MTYREAILLGESILQKAKIVDAKNDAWLLLAMACRINHTGNGVSWSQFEWKTYDTQMTVTFEDSVKVESISKNENTRFG